MLAPVMENTSRMNTHERNIKSINDAFAFWKSKLSGLAVLNFVDAHVASEHTVCDMLNRAFDWSLIKASVVARNHPGIDLVDDQKRIAVQVTSNRRAGKIQRTLDVFHSHELGKKYDRLIILIIGDKQRKYSTIRVHPPLNFDTKRDIWDLRYLLLRFDALPNPKLSELAEILGRAIEPAGPVAKRMTGESQVKKSIMWRNQLTKQLLRNLDRGEMGILHYEPWRKFRYDKMQIRSANARPFGLIEDIEESKFSSEFIGEPWDLYDNGLELWGMCGDAIFDESGHWDILGLSDEREKRTEYRVVQAHAFLRIPYEFMIKLDMDTNPRTGLPTLYVNYAKDGMPYEEIRYGITGVFSRKQRRRDFDPAMRRKLA